MLVFFVKNTFLIDYDMSTDRSLDDVLFVKLTNKGDNTVLTLCVCYLPPEHSSRHTNADLFFNEMMKKSLRVPK